MHRTGGWAISMANGSKLWKIPYNRNGVLFRYVFEKAGYVRCCVALLLILV